MTFDPDCRQLWRDGHERQHPSPKAFDLPETARSNGVRKPVAKTEDSPRGLWPGTFVSDTNIPTLDSPEIFARRWESRHIDPDSFARCMALGMRSGARLRYRSRPRRRLNNLVAGWSANPTDCALRGENLLSRERRRRRIVLGSSTSVASPRARIVIDGRRIAVEDLASKNGTYVNECRVTSSTMLGDGDRPRLALLVFTFQRARPAPHRRRRRRREADRPGSDGVYFTPFSHRHLISRCSARASARSRAPLVVNP